MESFFLAETTKYLYLLFDEDNFVHNPGNTATVHRTPHGECVVDAGGYVFNTEAHLIDPAALQCCSSHTIDEIEAHLNLDNLSEFVGDTVPVRLQQIETERQVEAEKRREEREAYQRKMEEQRAKLRRARKQVAPPNGSAVNVTVNSKSELERDQLLTSADDHVVGDHVVGNNAPNFSETIESNGSSLHSPTKQVLIKRQTKDETVVEVVQDDLEQDDSGIKESADKSLLEASSLLETFSGMLDNYLTTAEDFDIEVFRAKVYNSQNSVMIEQKWYNDHSILSCPAKHFLERFSVQGEFFESYR